MKHVLAHLARSLPAPSLGTTGDPRSATSAAPQGCAGQGMGSMPMSPVAHHVPPEVAHALSAAAQGIVTRMGRDPKGLGGEAIEPGPAGMRPACSGFDADCLDACATCARARWRSAGAGAGAGRAAAIPDGNHGDNKKEETE